MGKKGFYLEVTFPPIEFRLANAVVLSITTRGFVILSKSWELRVTGWLGGLRIWELGMTDEYLMWSLVAADRHARPAPQFRSRTFLCLCISRNLALLAREAIPFSLSFSVVQGVARSVLGSSAPVALVPPQLRPRRR